MLISKALRVAVATACLVAGGLAQAADIQLHRIGVLAFRSKEATLAALQPTAEHLSRSLPGHRFEILPLDLDGMADAVANRRVDFVYTNPENYIALEAHHRVTRIATIVQRSGGQPMKEFGGVVFVRSDRRDLQRPADLKGRLLAGVDAKAFGGFLMQAGELLNAGIDIRKDARLLFLGLPQDKIVQAVADGRADAGFVRTGVLESLAQAGKIDPADFRVINPRLAAGFPFLLSTRLYPEWPFAALPDTPDALARQVLIALLSIPADSAIAKQGGYHSWAIPLSYESVHDLMRALRVAPYDSPEHFNLRDVLRKYEVEAFQLLALAMIAAFLLTLRFLHLNRRLSAQVTLVAERGAALEQEVAVRQRAERRLAGENEVMELMARGTPLPMVLERVLRIHDGEHPEWPAAFLLREPTGRPWHVAAALHLPAAEALAAVAAPASGYPDAATLAAAMGWDPARLALEPVGGSTGEVLGCLLSLAPSPAGAANRELCRSLASLAALAIEQTRAAGRLALNASVFKNALEGIVVTDPKGNIVEVNEAFTRLTGYDRHEVLGRNPRILKSGLHDQVYYENLWQDLIRQGHWRGEVWNRRKDGSVIAEILQIGAVRDASGTTSHYVGTFSDITDLKETQSRLERAASFDSLTGLPNRSLLTDRLRQAQSHARRRGTLLAVCFLDLDGFKPVNDSLGHEAGDRLLKEVAARLEGSMRAGDTVARLGGDEFVLLLTDLKEREEMATTLTRILHHLAVPYPIDDERVQISASIGITLYPLDDSDPDTLLRHADQAMYRAKQEGRNRFHLFDTAHDEQLQFSAAQIQKVQHALADGQLRLHYQPKIDMASGRLVGVEALVRWQHPERGLLPPAAFLPAIEHHDLICALGDWVLREALCQRQRWAAQGLDLAVSVNVAARHFLKPDFVDRLKALLAEFPALPDGALELEIVETAAFDDLEAMAEVVLGCRELGVRFALDDFGTGYSSLTYLKLLPADVLKIDRSFIFEMLLDKENLSIVEGIVSLARAFQRDIIAEGVETTDHGTLLLRLGCPFAQGYGIARPMPGDDLPNWAAAYVLPPSWAAWGQHGDAKDFPLLVAEVEHRHWVESIIAATAGEGLAMDRNKIIRPAECGFGHWVERHGREHYGRHPDFPRVDALHLQVHEIANRILEQLDSGREREARKLVKSLREASDQLLQALAEMQLGRQSTRPLPP